MTVDLALETAAPAGDVAVTDLYRYPIKGLSPQSETCFAVIAGEGVPTDRRFALALGTTSFDPGAPRPLDKGFFLMLRRDTSLAALKTRYDAATGVLSIREPDGTSFSADLETVAGRATVEDFFLAYLGEACGGRPKLVEAPGHKFTDVSVISPAMMRAMSLVNLASVRDLSVRCGPDLDPLRFRANVYLDGLAPWAELGWVGRDLAIGTARFRCVLRTKRCAAVDVDPVSARRDTNLPKALVKTYGHPDCGVYLEVAESGTLRVGDPVILA